MYNYSIEVKRIFKNAENIALELNHPYVGTEHLLLSLLKSSDKVRNILFKYGLTYDNFLENLKKVVSTKKESFTGIYTPLLKRVINGSEKTTMDSLLLLASILEIGEGIAIRILTQMNIDIDSLYEEINYKDKTNNLSGELAKIGKDMTLQDNTDILIGRDKEISQVIETLLRKNKNNPLLIGPAGVGKSAIIEELARLIKNEQVPDALKNKKIISLEMSKLVAGTKYRGEFEEKLNKIIKEIENNSDIILFIDEIHTMANAGGAEGAINASDILKPYLARGKVKVIGATTTNEYDKYISKDRALARRFEIIKINEPTPLETEYILSKIKTSFEKHYNIKITNNNIKDIVSLTDKYILNRYNPDKSIDLLDSVCAKIIVDSHYLKDISKLKEKLNNIVKQKELMVKKNNFEEALKYRSMEIDILKKIEICQNKPKKLSSADIKEVLLRKENIPFLKYDFNKLKSYLQDNIISQDKAISKIIDVLKNREENIPVSILLTGSTGVGKTKTVKEIASFLKMPLVKIDLSEYNENSSISRLIGASAGYVGYEDENVFDKIKLNPCSIILLDELEKANFNVLNLFLQILDDGYITNSKGEKIDFKNTIIFATTNALKTSKIGFMSNEGTLENYFSKEFLSRFRAKISYDSITWDSVKTYLDKRGIKDYSIVKDFDYIHQGFRGIDNYLKKKQPIK